MDALIKQTLQQLGLFGGSVLFGIILYWVFRFCDGFFAPPVKREMTSRLQDIRVRPWSHVVVDVMDRVLVGKDSRDRWVPKFWRVTALSFFWITVFFFSLLLSKTEAGGMWAAMRANKSIPLGQLLLIFFILNPVVDYISAIETRWVLRMMTRRRGVGWYLGLAILDVIATAVLVLLIFSVILASASWWLFLIRISPEPLMSIFPFTHFFNHAIQSWVGLTLSGDVLAIYVYTTFATTIWTWLYLVAEGVFRVLPAVRRFFPIEQKPFRSMGLIVALFGGSCWFAIGLISRIWQVVTNTS